MHLFYTPEIKISKYTLDPEESRHCIKVLRLSVGDTIHLTDGRGALYKGTITSVDGECEVQITEIIENYEKRNYRLTMGVAPTKSNDRYEIFLEKATEIGIDAIIPVLCFNSERRNIKKQRFENIITSAVKQSIKTIHPHLEELHYFKELVERPFVGDKFIAHCRESDEKKTLKESIVPGNDTFILIGPEGDFTEEEIAFAKEKGFREISLGTTRLRVETAAIVACHTMAFINQ